MIETRNNLWYAVAIRIDAAGAEGGNQLTNTDLLVSHFVAPEVATKVVEFVSERWLDGQGAVS